jgi:hypothetical protein
MNNLSDFANNFFYFSPANRGNRIQEVIDQFIQQEGKNPVTITRKSTLTQKENSMKMNLFAQGLLDWKNGALIQKAMPHLSPDERDFLITGRTPEEFYQMSND